MFCCSFPYADETRMRIPVVSVPEAILLIPEGIHDQLDAGSGIGHKDDVKLLRIGLEKLQQPQSDIFNAARRKLGGVGGGVRVAVEVREHVGGEALDQRLWVERGSSMVEVGCP